MHARVMLQDYTVKIYQAKHCVPSKNCTLLFLQYCNLFVKPSSFLCRYTRENSRLFVPSRLRHMCTNDYFNVKSFGKVMAKTKGCNRFRGGGHIVHLLTTVIICYHLCLSSVYLQMRCKFLHLFYSFQSSSSLSMIQLSAAFQHHQFATFTVAVPTSTVHLASGLK